MAFAGVVEGYQGSNLRERLGILFSPLPVPCSELTVGGNHGVKPLNGGEGSSESLQMANNKKDKRRGADRWSQIEKKLSVFLYPLTCFEGKSQRKIKEIKPAVQTGLKAEGFSKKKGAGNGSVSCQHFSQ